MRELHDKMARERDQALREAQERARCDDENKRRLLDQQKRKRKERERKMKEEQAFTQLKDSLMNYDFQTCPRIKKEAFRDLDVGDIDLVRIALIGPTGSGKTSFVGTLQRALGEPQSAFGRGTEKKEGTIHLEEYSMQKQIRLVDTRGFFESDEKLFEECLDIMSGRIRPGEKIMRNYDQRQAGEEKPQTVGKAQELAKYAHAVVFVVKANDPRLKDGKYKETLKKIREHFREDGYAPVTVITYLDMLREEGDKETAFDMASWATGSSSERTFFIANYTHEKNELSSVVERTALDVLDFALLSAERFIRIRKQREKYQMERGTAALGAISRVETLEQFFARLKKKNNWTDQGKMKAVLSDLRSKEISTVEALKELWEKVKPDLSLSLGMKRSLEEEMKRDALAAGDTKLVFPKILKEEGQFLERPNVEAHGLVTAKGGLVAVEGAQVLCPPGAVDNPLTIKITLEEPLRHYGQIVNKGLENDVIFASPIINLQPNNQLFKKAVAVTACLSGDIGDIDSYSILHGEQNGEGKICWEDVTHNAKIDVEQKEVTVEVGKFSLLAFLRRLTLIPLQSIASLLNIVSFKYIMSVLFKNNYPLPGGELSFVFMKQDIYREWFSSEQIHCALVQLKHDGFEELCFNVEQDSSYPVYNSEYLQVSVHVGDDYKLAKSDQSGFWFHVDLSVWRSTGHVIKMPLQASGARDVRILCGRVNILGQHGHSCDGSFCELQMRGYVKRLLGIELGASINIKPIAQKLEVPEETQNEIIQNFWHKDEEQLESVLQHWMNENGNSENPAALRSALEGLNREDYRVKERGQMHIEHLRELAKKIHELKHQDAELKRYFANQIQVLCPNILRDCCIEMASCKEDVELAAATGDCVRFLEIHQRISEDFAHKIQRMGQSSGSSRSLAENFLSVVPCFIQTVKEIFRNESLEEVPSGLKGLPAETLSQFMAQVRSAEKHKSIPKMLCELCKILEKLCLNNSDSHFKMQIEMFSNSLQSLCLLKMLKAFFQSCENSKLYTRLEMFLASLRDIMSELVTVDEVVVHDFYDVSLSLIRFAKFDPSKLVRFELIGAADSPLNCYSEAIKHDRSQDTFSQQFQLRKDSDSGLELYASAHVHQQGLVGAFQSVIMLPASDEQAIDRLIAGIPVEVKKEFEGSENLRLVLCSSQKESISRALNLLQREMGEGVVDWQQTEITKVPLTVRTFAKPGTVVWLRLVYKWQSEAIGLDSKDFVALADSSSELVCPLDFQRTANLLTPSVVPLDEGRQSSAMASSLLTAIAADGMPDPSPIEVIQRHAHKQFERLEVHYHQNVVQSHNCVVGNDGRITSYRPTSDRCLLQGDTSGTSRRSVDAPPSQTSQGNSAV